MRALLYSFFLSLWLGSALVKASAPCEHCVLRNSSIIHVDGHAVHLTEYTDTSVDLSQVTDPPKQVSLPSHKRSPGECHTYKPPFCLCGAQFICECKAYASAKVTPKVADCQLLVQALSVFPEINGASFTLPVGTSYRLSYQTCYFQFNNPGADFGANLTSSPIEYCYDELAQLVGNGIQNCLQASPAQQGICGYRLVDNFLIAHT